MLKDLIIKYSDIILYLSSGFDFHSLYDLNKLNKLKNSLVIFVEIYPDIYYESKILESNSFELSDIFSNHVESTNIKLIDKLNVNIDKRLYDLNLSKYLNNVYLMDIKYITNEEEINSKICYIVSENASFVMDFLITNNIKVDTIYLKGIKGSNVNCAFLNKVIDKLCVSEIITNNKNILNKIDTRVEYVYQNLRNITPYSYKSRSIYELRDFIIINTKEKEPINKYEIIDKNNLNIKIDNSIFRIDFLKFRSEFSKDLTINGFSFKKNSIDNIIGLDLISFFGLHIENNRLMFLSISPNKSIKKYQIYNDFLYVLDRKIIRSQNNTIDLDSIVGLDIASLGIDGYINYNKIDILDIEGEYV